MQHIVALSTTEVEYIVFIEVMKKALWRKGITRELRLVSNIPLVYNDS